MRKALVVLALLVAGVGCGTSAPAKPKACDELYALLDRLESCTHLPGPVGKHGVALKRKMIDELIAGAKKQGNYEGLCRNEATVLRKIYARTAPECLK